MLKKLENLFTKTKMSWKLVIPFSVICGVVAGALMIPAALKNTSFQQPGISFEFWIFTALFIILNCEKPVEAGLKTFVFFLISQPIIYLVQVPFSSLHWQIFSYYPRWGIITLLTIPGAMLAWFVKKQNILSVLILSVANLILCYELPQAVMSTVKSFPRFIIYALFIIFELVFFILIIFKDKKKRLLAAVIVIVMLAASAIYQIKETAPLTEAYTYELQGKAPFEIVNEIDGADVQIDGSIITVTPSYEGSFLFDIKDAGGNTFTLEFSSAEGSAVWNIAE